ncbi:RING finger protein [Ceratocystis lukuohia]
MDLDQKPIERGAHGETKDDFYMNEILDYGDVGHDILSLMAQSDSSSDPAADCAQRVTSIFPLIDTDFLEAMSVRHFYNTDAIVNSIIADMDQGKTYPRQKWLVAGAEHKPQNADGNVPFALEMPSEDASLEELELYLETLEKRVANSPKDLRDDNNYKPLARACLKERFRDLYTNFIDQIFRRNGCRLLPTYAAILDLKISPNRKKTKTPSNPKLGSLENLKQYKAQLSQPGQILAVDEYTIVLHIESVEERIARIKEIQDAADLLDLKEGSGFECGCCFTRVALRKVVHCNSDEEQHPFCVECVRSYAETQIGIRQCQLTCISMDGCEAIFGRTSWSKFLSPTTIVALEKIERQTALSGPGLENIFQCPHCEFMAEYPPIEEAPVFFCQNPGCSKESCRSCGRAGHGSDPCQTVAEDLRNPETARHLVEEAMSDALIRRCNKCQSPFLKEAGCNKMTCSVKTCRNTQCYVCGMDADYSHFYRAGEGKRAGPKCPLWDTEAETTKRYEKAIEEARKSTLESILDQNPFLKKDAHALDPNAHLSAKRPGRSAITKRYRPVRQPSLRGHPRPRPRLWAQIQQLEQEQNHQQELEQQQQVEQQQNQRLKQQQEEEDEEEQQQLEQQLEQQQQLMRLQLIPKQQRQQQQPPPYEPQPHLNFEFQTQPALQQEFQYHHLNLQPEFQWQMELEPQYQLHQQANFFQPFFPQQMMPFFAPMDAQIPLDPYIPVFQPLLPSVQTFAPQNNNVLPAQLPLPPIDLGPMNYGALGLGRMVPGQQLQDHTAYNMAHKFAGSRTNPIEIEDEE